MTDAVRPNILWYCTDQQRFDTIGALGNPHVQTRRIDQLVSDGVAFERAYCQSPICTPSRSSFMTGMYPSRVHNCRNGNESFDNHPPLVSKLIADQGYDCGMIGKFHLQSSGRRIEPRLDDGYRYWRFSHAPRDDWLHGHDYAEWVRSRGGDLDTLRESEDRVPAALHQTTWATECAIEFLEEDRDGPWFLTINIYDPHPPFIPPREYATRFDARSLPPAYFRDSDLELQRELQAIDFQDEVLSIDARDTQEIKALYYAMIALIDDEFARLLSYLDQRGLRDNTVIVFMSDHGEMLGDHGLLYKGCRFYEGLVRVPLIVAWPGQFQADVRSPALVELIDLSATLLEIAGAPVPEGVQGKSLLPILRGHQSPNHHRDFARSEYFDALAAPFVSGDGSFATMYRDDRFKLVVYHGHGVGELYDLENDPNEFENVWEDARYADVKTRLVCASFDATMLGSIDVGTRRIAPM